MNINKTTINTFFFFYFQSKEEPECIDLVSEDETNQTSVDTSYGSSYSPHKIQVVSVQQALLSSQQSSQVQNRMRQPKHPTPIHQQKLLVPQKQNVTYILLKDVTETQKNNSNVPDSSLSELEPLIKRLPNYIQKELLPQLLNKNHNQFVKCLSDNYKIFLAPKRLRIKSMNNKLYGLDDNNVTPSVNAHVPKRIVNPEVMPLLAAEKEELHNVTNTFQLISNALEKLNILKPAKVNNISPDNETSVTCNSMEHKNLTLPADIKAELIQQRKEYQLKLKESKKLKEILLHPVENLSNSLFPPKVPVKCPISNNTKISSQNISFAEIENSQSYSYTENSISTEMTPEIILPDFCGVSSGMEETVNQNFMNPEALKIEPHELVNSPYSTDEPIQSFSLQSFYNYYDPDNLNIEEVDMDGHPLTRASQRDEEIQFYPASDDNTDDIFFPPDVIPQLAEIVKNGKTLEFNPASLNTPPVSPFQYVDQSPTSFSNQSSPAASPESLSMSSGVLIHKNVSQLFMDSPLEESASIKSPFLDRRESPMLSAGSLPCSCRESCHCVTDTWSTSQLRNGTKQAFLNFSFESEDNMRMCRPNDIYDYPQTEIYNKSLWASPFSTTKVTKSPTNFNAGVASSDMYTPLYEPTSDTENYHTLESVFDLPIQDTNQFYYASRPETPPSSDFEDRLSCHSPRINESVRRPSRDCLTPPTFCSRQTIKEEYSDDVSELLLTDPESVSDTRPSPGHVHNDHSYISRLDSLNHCGTSSVIPPTANKRSKRKRPSSPGNSGQCYFTY